VIEVNLDDGVDLLEKEKKQVALDILQDAWDEATGHGIEGEIVAFAALFAALADLVERFGESAVSEMMTKMPDRVLEGHYSINRLLH
jgi:hypothetical protein